CACPDIWDRAAADRRHVAHVDWMRRARCFASKETARDSAERRDGDRRRSQAGRGGVVILGPRFSSEPPSSRGPGRGPFKAKTRVRIPLGTPTYVWRPPTTV